MRLLLSSDHKRHSTDQVTSSAFKPGDMVKIAGRKSGRGKLIQGARVGVVMKPYEPTGAVWITRVQVLVDGELEDINVSWLTRIKGKKSSAR